MNPGEEVNEQVEAFPEDDGLNPRYAYPLVDESFLEGWAEPSMADYDRYEEFKR